jgi:hypothetical protein
MALQQQLAAMSQPILLLPHSLVLQHQHYRVLQHQLMARHAALQQLAAAQQLAPFTVPASTAAVPADSFAAAAGLGRPQQQYGVMQAMASLVARLQQAQRQQQQG